MSVQTQAQAQVEGHGPVHVETLDSHDAAGHGSLKGYLAGFFLSVVLTAIPFWLVMGKVIADANTTTLVIMGFAAAQIVVHMVFFLHMNTRSEGGWTLLALIFTLVLVVIITIGIAA